MNTILEAKNITKIYNRHTKNEFEALRGISTVCWNLKRENSGMKI